ncbi:hypothetical protein ES703_58506 [subsurface metagenome]
MQTNEDQLNRFIAGLHAIAPGLPQSVPALPSIDRLSSILSLIDQDLSQLEHRLDAIDARRRPKPKKEKRT